LNYLEMNLIRLLLEYPEKSVQIENAGIFGYFTEARLRSLGAKIVESYKLLGYIDINVLLSAEEDKALRNSLYELRINEPATDDNVVERNFADNIRGIKRKWYKEQHRQLKSKLLQAQEKGDAELLQKYLYEKQALMVQEKELL